MLLLAAVSLTVGWHSQLSALLVWILFLSFIRRNPLIFNAGDHVMINTALILAISGCGAALSLDQRRRNGRFWSAEERVHWPVRLLQVQLSLIDLVTAQTKLIGETWNDGTAVSFPWRIYHDLAILPAPAVGGRDPFWSTSQPGARWRSSCRWRSWCGIGGVGTGYSRPALYCTF